jgi:hypothetical protein
MDSRLLRRRVDCLTRGQANLFIDFAKSHTNGKAFRFLQIDHNIMVIDKFFGYSLGGSEIPTASRRHQNDKQAKLAALKTIFFHSRLCRHLCGYPYHVHDIFVHHERHEAHKGLWGALRAPVSLGISRAKNAKGAKKRN